MKDNFSVQSAEYARFRPTYPPALYDFLFAHCSRFESAWDCGTGNGQMALALAERFSRVVATDISQQQLSQAQPHPRVEYRAGPAESPTLPGQSVDLITAGQAAHWFHLEKFYTEVQRVLRPGGLLALIGYGLLRVDAPTDAVIDHLYEQVLGKYWDSERRHVDMAYDSLFFPFEPLPFPQMHICYSWTLEQMLGFLSTWSAVQHFVRQHDAWPFSRE
ncbi:MAG TPA: class I SAM-dependent methyltransferase [Saprospiraceae bacterium]|nr:class I SAM-dependent methyltransferase [Saprospiraceae bacterium]